MNSRVSLSVKSIKINVQQYSFPQYVKQIPLTAFQIFCITYGSPFYPFQDVMGDPLQKYDQSIVL